MSWMDPLGFLNVPHDPMGHRLGACQEGCTRTHLADARYGLRGACWVVPLLLSNTAAAATKPNKGPVATAKSCMETSLPKGVLGTIGGVLGALATATDFFPKAASQGEWSCN